MADTEIRELNAQEKDAIEQGLDFAAKLAGKPRPLAMASVQALYNRLLDQPDHSEGATSCGIAFGEQIIARSGPAASIGWLRVKDEFGTETCVGAAAGALSKRDVAHTFCAPVSMVRKRLKRGERADLEQLCAETVRSMKHRLEADRKG